MSLTPVRQIEIKTKRLSRDLFSGEYHSAFKGRGMAFSEVRPYQFGDDVRHIDWNVTARTGTPHVQIFEEERELTVLLLVDISSGMHFGSRRRLLRRLAAEVAATLIFSAMQNNDRVGALYFAHNVEEFIPPRKGRTHALRIIHDILQRQSNKAEGPTRLGPALRYFQHVVKKQTITFVLSDFLTDIDESALRTAARKHDLVGISLHDPLNEHLPPTGLIYGEDVELGESRWVDPIAEGHVYADYYKKQLAQTEQNWLRAGASWLSLRTDESFVEPLLRFFNHRG